MLDREEYKVLKWDHNTMITIYFLILFFLPRYKIPW